MKSPVLLAILLSVIAAYITANYGVPRHSAEPKQETSFERVMRTGTLRCGYEYWDGAVMKDNGSGKIIGPWVDIMNAIGTATNLKIEWTSQVGWGDVAEAIKSGKIDAMCAGMWTNALKASQISFSKPLAYQALEAFAREDDHRFDAGLDAINDPAIKVAVIDNDNSDAVAKQDFPKAYRVALGQLNGTDSELMMQVLNDKADVTFTVAGQWQQFNKNNPGKIRRIAPDKQLRLFGLAIALDNDDPRLLELINAGVQEIRNSNQLGQILDKANQTWPDMYIKPTTPY